MCEGRCALAGLALASSLALWACSDDGGPNGDDGPMDPIAIGDGDGDTGMDIDVPVDSGSPDDRVPGDGDTAEPDPCDEDSGLTGAALHDAVLDYVTPAPGSCNAGPCHDAMGPPRAALQLEGMTDLSTLVGQASCEVPSMPLVTAGDPGQSWLWLKLWAAPIDGSGVLLGDPSWGEIQACNQDPGAPFGVRMPWGSGASSAAPERLIAVCDWIQAGAPGPN
ncbi:MAG: hypothetical protein OXT09_24550 [Myxococcales bacterium]|nr:hypothetical protein [Myxococcales bacterium]